MADQLNMNGLNLQDSQHAGPGPNGFGGRSAYVPPHARQTSRPGPPGPPGPGMDGSAWGPDG